MKCKFCRGDVPEGAKICPTCGSVVESEASGEKDSVDADANQYQYGTPEQSSGQYQYGAQGQNSGQYQYGAQGQSYNQYQYGAPNQGVDGQGMYNQPGYGQPVKPLSGTPYMVFSILVTLFCCLPLGIVSIVYASKINSLQRAGDYLGAQQAAKKTKIFTIVGAVGGLLLSIITGIFMFSDAFRDEFGRKDTAIVEESTYRDDSIITEETVETKEKPEIQAAQPSSELGDTWNSYTIQMNDKVLTLPCTIQDLEAAGFTLDTDDTPDSYVVNVDEYILSYFNDSNGNYLLAYLFNGGEEPITAVECLVGGLSVDEYSLSEGGLTLLFPGGIQIGTTKADVLSRYGQPADEYEGDSLHMYTWYEEDSYYRYCEIDFDSDTELVSGMNIQNYE